MKTYYVKKKGKFVPAGSFTSFHMRHSDVLPIGWYLFHVVKGSRACYSQKTKIEPERAKLLCALKEFHGILTEEIGKASQMKYKEEGVPISLKARKLWNELQKELGNTGFHIDSASQIAEDAISMFEKRCIESTKK